VDVTDAVPEKSDILPESHSRRSELTEKEAATRRHPWVALGVVCIAQFMITLDATVVNVAAPVIQHSLHFSASNLSWIINAYTLFAGGFLLLGGRAGDLLGHRRIFALGVIGFTVASLFNGLAPNANSLIVGRGVQGLSAAFASPAALALLMIAFPDTKARTKAVAVWATISVSGGAVGVLLGGLLADLLSWRWIFLINIPIGIVTLLAAARFVPLSRGEGHRRSFDALGAVTVTAGCTLLVYGIVRAPGWGWASAPTIGVGAAALLLLAAFVFVERRGKTPLVRFEIFRIRSLSVGNGALFVFGGAAFSLFFFLSLYLQEVMLYKPLRAGVAFLPVFVASVLGAGIGQQLVKRAGAKAAALTGLVCCVVGMLLYARIPVHGSYLDVLGQMILISAGMGIATVPLTLLATTGVPENLAGLASGVNNMSQNIGRALGLAVLSSIAASHTTSLLHAGGTGATEAQVSGYRIGFIGSAMLISVAIVVVVTFLRRRDVERLDEQATTEPVPVSA